MWASIKGEGEKEIYREFSGKNCSKAVVEVGKFKALDIE